MERAEQKEKEKITDPAIAFTKICKFCAYQERSQQEVRDKLYSWGLWPDAVENIITNLIDENFLNEERFAISYARGKFRIKEWGKQKIKYALKHKGVSEPCIRKALSEIKDSDYLKTLNKVVSERSKKEKEKNPIKRNYKIVSHLISRGFEADLVWDVLKTES